MREKVDLLAQKLVTIEHVEQDNKLFSMLHVEKKVMDELSVAWKDALAVELLGEAIGFDNMKSNLGTRNLAGKFDVMEIGKDFFMVKFNSEDGKTKVIDGVPWKICNCYLMVRQWTSDFNVNSFYRHTTMVWVRILSLNFVYYDESFLWALASTIGKPVNVDFHTLRVEHGKFARVCVDIAF